MQISCGLCNPTKCWCCIPNKPPSFFEFRGCSFFLVYRIYILQYLWKLWKELVILNDTLSQCVCRLSICYCPSLILSWFPDGVVIIGTRFCPVDVVAKAFPSEKAAWKCMLSSSSFIWLKIKEVLFLPVTSFLSSLETSRQFIHSASDHRGFSYARNTSWFTWSWGVWVQWSFCTSDDSHNRVCTWSSFKYSFIPTIMGPQVHLLSSLISVVSLKLLFHEIKCPAGFPCMLDVLLLMPLFFKSPKMWLLILTATLILLYSLAHSELSSVFYEKVLMLAWGYVAFVLSLFDFFVKKYHELIGYVLYYGHDIVSMRF